MSRGIQCAVYLHFFLFLLLPSVAIAQPAAPVAVISLDGNPDPSIENEVAEELATRGLDVHVGEDVVRRLDARKAPEPDPEVAKQFSRMTTTIAAGVERFFYKGNQSAIEALSPMFDLGLAHPEVLARRPDFADQTFSAGVVLIRAYGNLEDTESMRAVVRLLVKTFPSKNASPTTVPPKVIRLLDEERARLSRNNTQISVLPVEAPDCSAYINGAPAEGGVAYVADPTTDYHLRLDCGTELAAVWKTRVAEGEQVLVPLTVTDPLRYRMADGDFRTRKIAENHLAAIAYWGELETVVGVSRISPAADDEVLLVRLESDGTARWSDGVTEKSVKRALARVFPELEGAEEESAVVRREERGVDLAGVGLVVGGALSVGTGVFLLATAQRRARVLSCSNLGEASAERCGDVERLEFAREEYDADLRAISTRRIIGWSALGVGVALAGWGVYRLIRTPSTEAVAYVGPTEAGVVVRF